MLTEFHHREKNYICGQCNGNLWRLCPQTVCQHCVSLHCLCVVIQVIPLFFCLIFTPSSNSKTTCFIQTFIFCILVTSFLELTQDMSSAENVTQSPIFTCHQNLSRLMTHEWFWNECTFCSKENIRDFFFSTYHGLQTLVWRLLPTFPVVKQLLKKKKRWKLGTQNFKTHQH